MLKDKLVVVTGGAGLLGSAFVKAILQQRGKVIIADVDEEKGTALFRSLTKKYGDDNCGYFKLDITSEEDLQAILEYAEKNFGDIHALVNSAYPRTPSFGRSFFDVEYQDFCDNMSLQLGGYFCASQQFAQYFKVKGSGNIINISSIYGVVAPSFEIYNDTDMACPFEYCAIKSSLIMMTKYMAKLLKDSGVRVNAISPGGIFDDQPESFLSAYKDLCLSKGMLDRNDISGALLFLLSDHSKYINGQNIIVDDGFTL